MAHPFSPKLSVEVPVAGGEVTGSPRGETPCCGSEVATGSPRGETPRCGSLDEEELDERELLDWAEGRLPL